MKWLILAIGAEIAILVSLIVAFDGALHSLATARLTWDHAAVLVIYTSARVSFSRRRLAAPPPARSALTRSTAPARPVSRITDF